MLRSQTAAVHRGSLAARMDWVLVGIVIALCVIGVMNLQSTSAASGSRVWLSQSYWLILGGVLFTVVASIDYRALERFVPAFYVAVVILLVAVLFTKEVNGSRRWIALGPANIQPSELAKLAVILAMASFCNKVKRPAGYTLRDLTPLAGMLAVPMFLVLKEPDLGHTLMLGFIAMTMLAYERIEKRSLMTLGVVVLCSVPLVWQFVLHDYQKDRILTLVDGQTDKYGTGWHAWQSRVAVGSGRVTGKGHGEGTQVTGGFLPENHTDFVFANLGEEHGLIGSAAVLLLYLFLIVWGLRIASQARDKFGGHIAVGVAALIFWQVVMNVGMVLNILPVTGVTLPLMSYGGSSALTVMIAMGLLLSVGLRRTVF
jgi:rod shape determining protein RodA